MSSESRRGRAGIEPCVMAAAAVHASTQCFTHVGSDSSEGKLLISQIVLTVIRLRAQRRGAGCPTSARPGATLGTI